MTATGAGAGAGNFRTDINGLRAWAVAAVVLYHFSVPGISGGYAGVDVFFVISGYLMCGIIHSGIENGGFSVSRFYLARARRIFPALFVLCVVLLILGWFFLMPEEYQQLGRHARESLTFTSNLRYLKESGYFDVAAQEKWLLHTWSLSVEWQFYLILPLSFVVISKFFGVGRSILFFVVTSLVLSFIWSVWITAQEPAEGFYTLQSRAWEMLAGALVFMMKDKRIFEQHSKLTEILGFALIVSAFLVFQKQTVWPGWRAILPVAGSMLVLLANRQRSIFTGGQIIQWLGTRSYSVYLWHWPLVVGLSYAGLLSDFSWVVVAIVLSLVFGHLSYSFVEVPARKRLELKSSRLSAFALVGTLVAIALLAQQVRVSGFPGRLPPEVAAIEAESKNDNPRLEECLDPEAYCIYGAENEPLRAIVMGDSHADAAVTAVEAALPNNQGSILFRGGSGCMIVFGMTSTKSLSHCNSLNDRLVKEHADFPPGVPAIIFGRTSKYVNEGRLGSSADDRPDFFFNEEYPRFTHELLQEFSAAYVDTLCSLAQYRPVYVVRPMPEMPVDVPTLVGRGLLFGEMRNPKVSLADYQRQNAFVMSLQDEAAKRCGVRILDPRPYLCDDQSCYGGYHGRPIYRDQDHLSEFGNRLLLPLFERFFKENMASSN